MATETPTDTVTMPERERSRDARDPAAVLRRLAARKETRARSWLDIDLGAGFDLHIGIELTMAAYLRKIADEVDRGGPDRVLEHIDYDRSQEAIEIGRGFLRPKAAIFASTASPFRMAESITRSLLDPELRAGDREWRRRHAARRRAEVVQQDG